MPLRPLSRLGPVPPAENPSLEVWLDELAASVEGLPFSYFSTANGPNESAVSAPVGFIGIEIGSSATTKLWGKTSSGSTGWKELTALGQTAARDGAKVRKSSRQTISDNSWTAITWETEVWDTGSYHDPSAPATFTATKAGDYRLTGLLQWNSGSNSSGLRQVRPEKNGTLLNEQIWNDAGGDAVGVAFNFIIPMALNDTLKLTGLHTDGADLAVRETFSWMELKYESTS